MAVKDTTDKGNSHRYETDVKDDSGSHSEKESESLTEVVSQACGWSHWI